MTNLLIQHLKTILNLYINIVFVFSALIFSVPDTFAQPYKTKTNPFIAPVDIEILLSGNFAELRSSHFHTGIDIKTRGETGHNIYAIANGYVSRIKVSPYGYGKALYIKHLNGYTSVYAHLKDFNIQIDQYVEKKQYARKKFALNLYPEKFSIPINQGDVIGKSGNSGSSSGPHLHFEIRKTSNAKPQNPMLWDFDIKDNIAPRFHYLILYPLSPEAEIEHHKQKKLFSLKHKDNKYKVSSKKTLQVSGLIGVGAYVNDYLNNTYNRCGVHQLKLFLDKKLIYHLKLDELSFAENRYILSHMDYALKTDSNIKAHKCYIEPGNKFSGYTKVVNDGKFSINTGERKKLRIEAIDIHGNKSVLKFQLLGKEPAQPKTEPSAAKILQPKQANVFQSNKVNLKFPRGTLYKKIYFTYEQFKSDNKFLSDIHKLHDPHEPVHKRYNIAIKTKDIAPPLQHQLYLASIQNNESTAAVTSNVNYKNGWAHTKIREFGTFAVMADTIVPKIKPLNIRENKDMSGEKSIKIKINDKETGINKYNGYINDKWVCFEYDAKNDLLIYEFDEHMPKAESYTLKMVISDRKQNVATKTINFQYSTTQTSLK